MNTIGFTKKYSSLSNAEAVNSLAEVTEIKNKEFTVYQHGQHWHSRLACWIKDSVRSFFSPLRKNTRNTAWDQLSADLRKDDNIQPDNKELAQIKIERWQKKMVPLRVLHIRQLLRQLDKNFDSQAAGVSVKSTLIPKRASLSEARICSAWNRLPTDGDRFDIEILDPPQIWGNEDRRLLNSTQIEDSEDW